jgi:hypothetical protein
MKKIIFFLSAISLIPVVLLCSSNYKFEKNVTVPQNEIFSDNVISFGGTIDIKGKLEHSLILIGGSLTLDGEVGEDIICFGSRIEIGGKARVQGDLYAIGGKLTKETTAKLMGDFTYFRFDLKKIESTVIPFLSDARTFTFFKIIKIILWFIITLIVFAVVPQKIIGADALFDKHKLKIGTVGLLSLFSFIFLLFVFILMFFILIGIPLLFALLLIYFAIFIFGRTVIFYYIGNKIADGLKLKNIMPALFILFGWVVYGLLKFVPVVGPVILLIINLFEIGIGVGFILRKKLKLVEEDQL